MSSIIIQKEYNEKNIYEAAHKLIKDQDNDAHKNVNKFLETNFKLINKIFYSENEEYEGGIILINEDNKSNDSKIQNDQSMGPEDFRIMKYMLENDNLDEIYTENKKKGTFIGSDSLGMRWDDSEEDFDNHVMIKLLSSSGYYMSENNNVILLEKISSLKDKEIKICIIENFHGKKLLSQIILTPRNYGCYIIFNGIIFKT
jgi:hypothetical protein